MKLKRNFGTSQRRTADIRRLGRALQQAGIDPRHWTSYGVVCTVGADGNPDFADKKAVYIGPEGVECDVVLEPLNIHVTALYSGIQGGPECTFLTPIKPGNRVLVILPDGDPTVPPVIASILHSAYDRVPSSGGKPIFQNDRVFLWAENVDIDVRTKSGGTVTIKQDGTVTVGAAHVNLGAADADQQLVRGTDYRSAEHTMNAGPIGLSAAFNLLQAAAVGPLAVLKPGFLQAKAAIDVFEANASDYLSGVSKTK